MPGSKPGERRGGRPKGSPNKITTSMRECFRAAFDELGGVPALVAWGRENQTEFYKLTARLIPVEVTGANGSAIEFRISGSDARL